jgi:hypothetical protein
MNRATIAGLTSGLMLLTACQPHTLAGMRTRDPVLSADSQKSTVEIGSCLVKAVEKTGAANYVPNPEGATVSLSVSNVLAGQQPILTADIKDHASSRHVTIWMFKTVWSDNNRHQVEHFRACL